MRQPDTPTRTEAQLARGAQVCAVPAGPQAVARWRRETRARLIAARSALPATERHPSVHALSGALEAFLEASGHLVRGRIVSGFWPIRGEPDLRALMDRLHRQGVCIALPVVDRPAAPLVFRPWSPGSAVRRGYWNIPEPDTDATVRPDVVLAPLVGWDGDCFRLGHGGGYFDRTLAALRPAPVTIGAGFQSARLETIFPQPHDIRLDAIVTEVGVQARADP